METSPGEFHGKWKTTETRGQTPHTLIEMARSFKTETSLQQAIPKER
jgi:hypothetical protein